MDVIADMITIIRNGYLARKEKVSLPYSSLKEEIAKKLKVLGFLADIKVEERTLVLDLLYKDGQPAIRGIQRVSKPSLRVYKASGKLPKILSGLGEVIVSTPKGILAGREARKQKQGGEVMFKVW